MVLHAWPSRWCDTVACPLVAVVAVVAVGVPADVLGQSSLAFSRRHDAEPRRPQKQGWASERQGVSACGRGHQCRAVRGIGCLHPSLSIGLCLDWQVPILPRPPPGKKTLLQAWIAGGGLPSPAGSWFCGAEVGGGGMGTALESAFLGSCCA